MSSRAERHALLRPLRVIAAALFNPQAYRLKLGCNPGALLAEDGPERLNSAFIALLAGNEHPHFEAARHALYRNPRSDTIAQFYRHGVELVEEELANRCMRDSDFAHRFEQVAITISEQRLPQMAAAQAELFWELFFPEAAGLGSAREREAQADAVRRRRTVRIRRLAAQPLRDPGREVLFSANALFTMPSEAMWRQGLALDADMRARLAALRAEPQRYWYDHPIRIGGAPEANEALYGLRALDRALAFEPGSAGRRTPCLLSLSVTHDGLRPLARDYLRQELARTAPLKHIDLYAFSESDCERLRREVLLPAARHYLGQAPPDDFAIIGVDGAYGRHYSFLKAIGALWQILIDAGRRATFKIDLDQIFPQERLVAETGLSAFGHLATPLWGAQGETAMGEDIELGMLAGALVNEQDFYNSEHGLFTLDVPYPTQPPRADQFIFYSRLPQALSTEVEMGARIGAQPEVGGECLQRIHVTGGTNGILMEHLRRHRPFTPSFIGRAEDQAYLLATMRANRRPLGYVHEPGLIMRHDKQAFAAEAIEQARAGTQIGDYIRTLYFSAYACAIDGGSGFVKRETQPFSGGFISAIPHTVTSLRLCLQSAAQTARAPRADFIALAAAQLAAAREFVSVPNGRLVHAVEEEQRSWNCYYDLLERLEAALQADDSIARAACHTAQTIVEQCRIV